MFHGLLLSFQFPLCAWHLGNCVLASLATYLKEHVFYCTWNILIFLMKGAFLFYHMAGNGDINSFFILQPERTFSCNIQIRFCQSCLKHWSGFPVILGWKLKSIVCKALNEPYLVPHPHVAPFPFSSLCSTHTTDSFSS